MSVYNPQTSQTLLEQLDNMSSDIREQKKIAAEAKAAALAAAQAAQAAQGTANTALSTGQAAQSIADAAASAVQIVSGTVQTISAEMVRKFTSSPIAAAAFVLDAATGYYYATVSHLLGDAAPDIEVYDADKDKQRIQSIIVDNDTIKLELDAEDMASNSFPLTCIVLGKNTPVPTGVGLGTGYDIQMFGTAVKVQRPDGTLVTLEEGGTDLIYAYNGRVYIQMQDGVKNEYAEPDFARQGCEDGDWNTAVANGLQMFNS